MLSLRVTASALLIGLSLLAAKLSAQDATPATDANAAASAPAGIRSNDDTRTINVAEGLDALLSANEHLVGSTPRATVTFAAAIAKAHELAHAAVSPAALRPTLQALPDNNPGTLRLFAFALLAKGQPDAVFAVLVAAYDQDPNSADALADLAGMLAGFGYANEALTILDELVRRGMQPSPPMGWPARDLTDYTRGYALVRLGDTAAARPLLRGVVERQPELAEAARLLAIVSDDPEEKRKFFLLGVWRHRSPLMVCAGVDLEGPEPDPMTAGEEVAIDVRSLIDLSKGKRGVQPPLRYATGVPQANDLAQSTEPRKEAAREQASALMRRRGKPQKYHHTDAAIEDTWGYRMQWLAQSVDYRDARMRELDRRRHTAWRERADAERRIKRTRDEKAGAAIDAYAQECIARKYSPTFEQVSEKARPAFEEALTQLKPYMNREELAEREWFAEWHLLNTAIAAQIGDPGWHEYVRLSIEAQRLQSYARLLHLVDMHAQMGAHPGITKEAGEVSTEPKPEDVEKCDGNKGLSFGTDNLPGADKLPFGFNAQMTCEGMSLEASVATEVPGVSLSAEIGGDNAGSFTAFVGPKAEVSGGVKGIAEFGASAKAGAYVSGNRSGVQEAGVKYVVNASGTVGSTSTSREISAGQVNFIPAPDPGDGGLMPIGIR
jgi:hypothetical protein